VALLEAGGETWGDAGLARTRALLSGTDIPLFQEAAGKRIYFDTSKTFEAPLYCRTLAGGPGLTIPIQGSNLTNIAGLYRASTNGATQRLVIEEVDLLGLFNKSFVQKTFDRAGHLLEERTGVLRKPADFSPESLGGCSVRMLLVVEDPAAVCAQAIRAGATEIAPVADDHCWRLGRIVDPFGHHWEIGGPLG